MHFYKAIVAAVLFFVGAMQFAHAAAPSETPAVAPGITGTGEPAHAEGHHGLPPDAPRFHLGPLVFTNSMVVTWIVAIALIIFAQIATRKSQLIPSGLQNFVEWMVEGLYDFLSGILGSFLVKKSFWFFATLFIFILFTNWFGLLPGVGTIFYKGEHGWAPILRGGNADLNMTIAMALVFFFLWIVWSVQALGVGGSLKHIFVGEGGGTGAMKVFMVAIFFFVGVIEVISIMFRPVSLSFRLYGNIFAGENILESMMTLVPWLGWLLPLPFYFLELLVGLVQALVFTLLTAVFTALMIGSHGEHGHAHGAGHSAGAHAHH
ncbi:MAG: F0F1 ATP synthase subunit A [Verrucomicrobiota bacterium]